MHIMCAKVLVGLGRFMICQSQRHQGISCMITMKSALQP
jgi:hypothetical protein